MSQISLKSENSTGELVEDVTTNVAVIKKEYSSGLFLTSINAANIIIGSGIVTLPISFANSGIGMGIIIIVISACLGHFTVLCLSKLAEITQKHTYQSLVEDSLGLFGYIVTSICIILYPLFSLLTYGIVIAGNFQNIFYFLDSKNKILQNKFLIVGVSMYLIVFPLSMFRNIAFLDKVSVVSIIFVVYYFLIVMIRVPNMPIKQFIFPSNFSFVRGRIPQSISVIAFALSCHQAIPSLYRSQKNRSVNRFAISTYIGFIFSTVIYILMAVFGYISFAGSIDGNIFENYCPDDRLVTSARFIFSITIILTSPLQLYTTREAICNICYKYFKFNWYFHTAITFVLISIIFIISSLVNDLGLVVAISGALIGAPVVYILPSISLFFGLRQGWKLNNKTKIFCFIVALLGLIILILGVVMSILDSGTEYGIRYWCDLLVNKPSSSTQPTPSQFESMLLSAWESI